MDYKGVSSLLLVDFLSLLLCRLLDSVSPCWSCRVGAGAAGGKQKQQDELLFIFYNTSQCQWI